MIVKLVVEPMDLLQHYYEDYPLYNDTEYPMYEEGEVPSPAMSEVLVPVLIYSATYLTGLLGNILILVAVTGQKQVRCYSYKASTSTE